MGVMLSVRDLHVSYGAIKAIKGISFDVNEGEIVTLIGANGAGKTTTLHAISRLLHADSGEIEFCGHSLTHMEAYKIIKLGLTQVPEGRRVFANLTVQQNLEMGAYTRTDGPDAIAADYEMVFERLPRLKERRRQTAGTLSGGEQQMLAISRALMASPKLLLLDEPSLGLAPLIIRDIFHALQEIRAEGTTILIVEQNALATLKIADRAYVLELGRISMEGRADVLIHDERLIEAYLGNKKS